MVKCVSDDNDDDITDVQLGPGYRPHPAQERFHAARTRFLSACSGVRGGKTKSSAIEFVVRIVRDLQAGKGNKVSGEGRRRRPRLHYWIVAPTAALLREPQRYLLEVIPRDFIQAYFYSDAALWLKNDILIEFKTADNPLHLVASGLHGLWIDEAARIKQDAWSGQLRQRLSDHKGWALFSTTPLGRNWLYEEIVKRADSDPDFANVSWTTAENPYIPPEEIEAAKRQLPARFFAREYLASFDAFSGNVFEEFDPQIHVTSEAQLKFEYHTPNLRSIFRNAVAGVDWGWNAPGCIIVIGEIAPGNFVIIDESYAPYRIVFDPRLSKDTWVSEARRLKDLWGITRFFCDPENQGNINDFQRAGLPVTNADNEVVYGIRKFAEALHPHEGRPMVRIMNTCKNLLRELPAYVWMQPKSGQIHQDMPAANQSDHSIDAARYSIMELMRYMSGTSTEPVRVRTPIM